MPVITQQAPLPTSSPLQSQGRFEQEKVIDQQVPPEVIEEKPKEDPLGSKFALLARKEKAISSRIMELKAREEAIKKKEEEYNSPSYIPKSRLSEDPLSVLRESGIEYEKLTELMLNQGPQPDPLILELKKELQELKDAQKKSSTDYEETQKKSYEQAVSQIRNDVKILVDSDSTFETIKETNSQDAVVELIEQTFQTKGVLLSVEDASREVEEYLIEQALKMANLNKVKQKLSPLEAAMKSQDPTKQSQQSPIKTLTNANTQTSTRPLSGKDRRERAIAAFQGKLQG